ncbi:hypothetical protein [Streptomyces sp. NPDC006285]|uniref:hypothetical protein n=1 Tax=Streptomyces sp. NPDC006285 TaxID=3364742 RepID=UPI0036CE8943
MSAAPLTVVDQHTDLISQLAQVLQGHPLGDCFQLLYAPDGLPLTQDEVLVQTADPERRIIELRPTPLSDVASGDLLHDMQTVALRDSGLTAYAQTRPSHNCAMHKGTHWYV